MARAKLSRGKGQACANHGAGAAEQVPNACKIFCYASEGFFRVASYSEACEIFQRTEALESVKIRDGPRYSEACEFFQRTEEHEARITSRCPRYSENRNVRNFRGPGELG